MNDRPEELTRKLQDLEHRLRATDEERARVETSIWSLYESLLDDSNDDTQFDRRVGRAEVVALRFDEKSTNRNARLWLAAAVILIIGVIGTVLLARSGDDTVRTTDTPDASATTNTETTVAVTDVPITADDIGATLNPGRYSISLDSTTVAFELADMRTVIEVDVDLVTLELADPGIGASPKRVTIASVTDLFENRPGEAWFNQREVFDQTEVSHSLTGRLISGTRADDWELEVQSDECQAFEPCLSIATTSVTASEFNLIEESNRLVVVELENDRALVVLGTAGGHRSGVTQSGFNAISGSLTIKD